MTRPLCCLSFGLLITITTFAQGVSDIREGYYIKYKMAHVSMVEGNDGQFVELAERDEVVGMNESGNYLCVLAKLDLLGNMSFRFIEIDEGGTVVSQGGPFYDGKTELGPVSGLMRQVTARIVGTSEGLLITEEIVKIYGRQQIRKVLPPSIQTQKLLQIPWRPEGLQIG